LVVEDSEDDTRLMVRELERGGYNPVFERVETAEAMTAALAKQTWDVVLADYNMPHFSAPEALTLLQKRGLDLPFIIVSGSIGEDTAVAAMKAGAHDYLMKDNLKRLVPAIKRELLDARVRRERKQAEEELQKAYKEVEKRVGERTAELAQSNAELAVVNEELEAFSYSVSHDLRAPLRSINGFSQALLKDYTDRLDEQGREYLQRVRSATKHMGMLIDDLLSLSSITQTEMRHETVDLSALTQSIANEFQEIQPEREVTFVIAPGVTANGDIHLLRILLENLLGNACKFTGDRLNARIEFGVTQIDDKKTFFVRDNGAGFDMKYADKLFVPFRRLHSQDEFPGTGIGLAMVQRIVYRHGGQVWAEGKPEEGATFYFKLD
jgi:signal transduction histidine kinase